MATADILNNGIQCLLEKLGVVETERFISVVMREQFDYTKWQEKYFDSKTDDQIKKEINQFENEHPYNGNAKEIL